MKFKPKNKELRCIFEQNPLEVIRSDLSLNLNSQLMYRVFIFLLLNFSALAIGGLFTSTGVASNWYMAMNKAPWTPAGWVFGFAWSTIMICYSFYMAHVWKITHKKKTLIYLFGIQWILNTLWNPVFFYFQNAGIGLVVISSLTIIIGLFGIKYYPKATLSTFLIAPYFIWLLIATSLNAYIVFYN